MQYLFRPSGTDFKTLHFLNPHIKSSYLAKTESLLIFVQQKMSSGPMWNTTYSQFMRPFLILNKTVQYSWVITTKWSRSYQVVSRLQEVLNALLVNWSHWLSWSVGHFIAICEQGEQLCAVKDHFLPPGPQPVEPQWRKCWKSKCKYFWSIMDLGAFYIISSTG